MQTSLNKYLHRTDDNFERAEKYVHFYRLAKEKGVVPFRYERIAEEYTDDYFADTGIDKDQKEWFYQREFASYKAGWYGLTKDYYKRLYFRF